MCVIIGFVPVFQASLLYMPMPGLYRLAYNFSPMVTTNIITAVLFLVSMKGIAQHSPRRHDFVRNLRPLNFTTRKMAVVVAALIDFFFVKHGDLIMLLTPNQNKLLRGYLIYIFIYFSFIHVNYYLTKAWPYPNLGTGIIARVVAFIILAGAGLGVGYILLYLRGGLHDLAGMGVPPDAAERGRALI